MTIRLLAGDCRDVLATLPDASVHCVVTSPPYYGLRDYGTAQWDGGDAGCSHVAPPDGGRGKSTMNSGEWHERWIAKLDAGNQYRDTCGKCGATRVDRQIGLEATPDEYLATMVQVFREVKRVLRPDGTVWCNIGDSYSGGKTGRDDGGRPHTMVPRGVGGAMIPSGYSTPMAGSGVQRQPPEGLAAKQLLLMPARLALALQADGWWVRSDIIWHKPNPMPESCTDRPTSAHEHVFLLTRSARYFYDADAVREAHESPRDFGGVEAKTIYRGAISGGADNRYAPGRSGYGQPEGGRNLRNVWTIATHAYSAAHFATFPPELASRCIRAGTSERGCCAQCGAPWRRVTSKAFVSDGKSALRGPSRDPNDNRVEFGADHGSWDVTTTGWSPSCGHNAAVVSATVLDPFFGAGTTGLVADRLGRDCIGIDLNPDYNAMSRARITDDAPLFAAFPVTDPADERMADLFAPLAAD